MEFVEYLPLIEKKKTKKNQLDQDLDWNDKGPSQNFTSNNMRFSDDFGGIEVN